jgi:N6-adenosine-specific RNA methylase IME4
MAQENDGGEAAQVAEALRLKAEGLGLGSIGKEMGCTKGYVRHLLMRERLKGGGGSAPDAASAVIKIDPQVPLEFHPLANLFPLIDGAEFDDLVADIKANGQHEDIMLLDGKVLDGRNRYRACLVAGVAPRFVAFRQDPHGEPLAFVVSKNLKRRHLNESQRAMVAARLETYRHGDNQHSSGDANLHVRRDEAAKQLGVSPRSVASAAVVRDKATPEIVQAVDRGRLPISQAAVASRLSREQQQRIAEEAEAGRVHVARTAIKQAARALREHDLGVKIAGGNLDLPSQKFGVILADPAWGRTIYSEETGMDRHAGNHYPVASGTEETQDDAIKALPVGSIAADDCVLGLWCTDLHRGVDVLRAWDFKPKTYFVWVKDVVVRSPGLRTRGSDYTRTMLVKDDRLDVVGAAGTGYWRRDRCEIMLIGVRGRPVCPAPGTQGESVWFARRGEHAERREDIHSDKPEISYAWFERHWPTTPKIELHARRERPGWSCWGLDAPHSSNPETKKCPAAVPADEPGKDVENNEPIHQAPQPAQYQSC